MTEWHVVWNLRFDLDYWRLARIVLKLAETRQELERVYEGRVPLDLSEFQPISNTILNGKLWNHWWLYNIGIMLDIYKLFVYQNLIRN